MSDTPWAFQVATWNQFENTIPDLLKPTTLTLGPCQSHAETSFLWAIGTYLHGVVYDLDLLRTAVSVCGGENPLYCSHRHPFIGHDERKFL